jgi:replicative DNA helicase
MGKTTVALNIAFNAAYAIRAKTANPDYAGVVAFFSLEMSRSQLAQKLLSSQTEIPSDSMREGRLSDYELKVLSDSANFLNDLPLVIDETPAMSVASIRAKARRVSRKHGGLALIVIDYLQLMQSSGGRKNDNRVQELSEITRGLKMLAKDLDVPVVALSQLSRSVDSKERVSKKPILSDLRDSGSIEQDADIVMFTYREEYYLKNRDPEDAPWTRQKLSPEEFRRRLAECQDKAELVIGKNRHGPIRDVKLNCQLQYSLFSDSDEAVNVAPAPEDAPPPSAAPPAETIPDSY